MQILELILDEQQMASGIDAISIVKSPAIESNFIALNDHKVKFATVDADKRILLGPALIPNKPIYRKQDGMEFYCYFSRGTVKKASELYLQRGNQNQATLEHAVKLQGICLVETWIKEDMEKDKSAMYGMTDPIGTWMVALKVENDEVWNDYVKTGLVNGFSIEGYFVDKGKVVMAKEPTQEDRIKSVVDILTEYHKNVTK
jgi:hypothetical protein